MTKISSNPDLTYEQAMDELNTILESLETSEVDVDLLASKVKRGNELLKFCKSRLEKVSNEVNTIIQEIEETSETATE